MRGSFLTILFFVPVFCFCQQSGPAGIYRGEINGNTEIILNPDSTFTFTAAYDPIFYRFETFSEKGRWTFTGDSILLNPALPKKDAITTDFSVQESSGSDSLLVMTFNHIKRHFDSAGHILQSDTVQIMQLDYAFNEFRKKNRTRVTKHLNTCTFAGYIPKAIITGDRTIAIQRPTGHLQSIFIGCYELHGVKEFAIKNQRANLYTFNVYSNYYQDGQIRNVSLHWSKNGSLISGITGKLRRKV